ncbi:MAG: HAMP domain-containing sensor histidine kinase [Myxococcota bacterium]
MLASHAAVALAVIAVALLVVERSVSRGMEEQIDRRLESQAVAVARWLKRADHAERGRPGQGDRQRAGQPDRLASRLAGVVGARVTIIDPDDVAIGDSHAPAGSAAQLLADELAKAPEVQAAHTGAVGRATRFSALAGAQVRYVAVPALDQWVVRLGLPIGSIDDTKGRLRQQFGVGALASLVVALALAALVAAALTRRLRAAQDLAQRIAAGDYDVAVGPAPGDEVDVLSKTLASTAGQLAANEAHRREFLANVAHEVRTPVTSIRGYAETLDSADVDPDTRREFVHTIHRNAVRIGQLVDNLLELEALQAGKGRPLARKPVQLAPVVAHVVATLQARTGELSAEIACAVADDLSALGDPDAIERILLNLVDNALRHGGAGVHVTIAATRRDRRIAITVSDDGPGIPDPQKSRIFERFHSGGGGGSGLGLAIARELAQAMDGALSLRDDSSVGAAFTLELTA